MASTYLTRTPSSAGNRKTWTISLWFKKSSTPATWTGLIEAGSGSQYFTLGIDGSERLILVSQDEGAGGVMNVWSNQVIRDLSGWYHYVVAYDSTQATASDRVKGYINGEEITSFSNTNYPDLNKDTYINGAYEHRIGRRISGTYFNGSMSHIHFIDGTAYDASAFGETDSTTGEWKINTSPSVTYGTNGFFILKDGNSVTDQSGNSNNFTVGGGTLTNTEDCPSNVFATFNPLDLRTGSSAGTVVNAEFSNGNLTALTNSSDTVSAVVNSTLAMNVGKWYMEFKAISQNSDLTDIGIVSKDNWDNSSFPFATQDVGYAYRNTGDLRSFSGTVSYGNSYTTNDIIGIALDLDNGVMWFSKNGTWQNSATISEIENGTTTNAAFTGLTSNINFVFTMSSGGDTNKYSANFGNGYFGTTAVSSAGTNASGNGIFEYDVPTGFTALSTKGLNL